MSDDTEELDAGAINDIMIEKAKAGLVSGYAEDDLPPGYEDTARYKRLKNGAVFDKVKGRIVSNPGGGISPITQGKNPHAIHAERVMAAKLAAQKAVAELASSSVRNKTSAAGWARVVSAQAELALDIDRGRASTDAARFVGQATGFLDSSRRDDDDNKAVAVGAVGLLAGVLSQFIGANMPAKQQNEAPGVVIDADWINDSPE